MAKKRYTVVSVINHDNKRYEIDASIDLDDEQAEGLLAVKAIVVPDGGEVIFLGSNDAPTDPAVRLSAITTAIGQLDPNNEDVWLKDGKPSGDAIAAITGWAVTAAERNAAWARL